VVNGVIAPLFAVLASQAAPPFRPSTPLDLPTLRQRLREGDLVSIERARAALNERGESIDRGSLGLLDDLSRLMRCLPLGPIPSGERAPFRAARLLARFERVRIERRLREGIYQGTALDALLEDEVRHRAETRSDLFVRWPVESERWPGEVPDPRLMPPRCTAGAGPAIEGWTPEALAAARTRAEREFLEQVAQMLDDLPSASRSVVAFELLSRRKADEPALDSHRASLLRAAIEAGEPPVRSAGLMLLARDLQEHGDEIGAIAAYRSLLNDSAATNDEDSRARVHLSQILEPDWPSVLEVVNGARSARPNDRAPLAYAEARALYSLGDLDGLERFGRVWLRSRPAQDSIGFAAATEQILLELALHRSPADALRWISELPGDRSVQLDRVGKLAVDTGRTELASAIYDRLRIDAASDLGRRGPAAAADLAHWTAERALVEYETKDAAAFAGLIDDLVRLANDERDRPLARTAPHRQIARLCQTLLGRITNDAAASEEPRKYAAALLEAITALTKEPSRWRTILEDHREPLRILAGSYTAERSVKPGGAKPKRPPIKSLGEVVIPRLPPRLTPKDEPTPLPQISSFVVHEREDGTLLAGPPWVSAER
jgi:hypothetical protein